MRKIVALNCSRRHRPAEVVASASREVVKLKFRARNFVLMPSRTVTDALKEIFLFIDLEKRNLGLAVGTCINRVIGAMPPRAVLARWPSDVSAARDRG